MLSIRRAKIIEYFKSRFGKDPLQFNDAERVRERLPQIAILYSEFGNEDTQKDFWLDDITWADLEMDEVFLRINQTQSYIGEQTLYGLLRSGQEPFFRENREIMDVLDDNEEIRLDLSLRLARIGKKYENYYLPEFLNSADVLRPTNSWVFRILQAALAVTALLAVIMHTIPFLLVFALCVCVNFAVSSVMKMRYEILLSSLTGIGNMLDMYSWCIHEKSNIFPVSERTAANWTVLGKIRKKIGILVYVKQASASGDVLGILFDYIFGVLLVDVSRIDSILKMIFEGRKEMLEAYTYVGMLDAAVSILSFRRSLSSWADPVFTDKEVLEVKGIYHPLLKDPVGNDFILKDRAVITGANASGKSTFMKALAVNTVLAQTIDTCSCTAISLPFLKVMTSMAIRDDVVSGESYYVREVRYLKRMLDEISQGTMALYVIDEILKGTNQTERLAASEAVLDYISRHRGLCMIATHDMELVDHLQDKFEPYYFESHIESDNVVFDYTIHKGRGGETNALALLQAFGFPGEIVQQALSGLNKETQG